MAEKKDCDIILEHGCLVCEKDKIIKQLREESSELKRLLRLALNDFEFIYDEHSCTGECECDTFCPYNGGEEDCCKGEWKHAEEALEALKLIGDDK